MSKEFTVNGYAWTELVEDANAAGEELQEAADAFNKAVGALSAFRIDVASDLRAAMEEKSVRWLGSKRGKAVLRLRDAWAELELPEKIDVDDPLEALDGLTDLPTTPDEA